MIKSIGKFVLDWLGGHLISWIDKLIKKLKIDSEENSENDELKKIKEEIKKWQEKHGSEEIPPHLQKRLDDAARRRAHRL